MKLRCAFCLEMDEVPLARAAERPRCSSCDRPFLLDRPVKVAQEDFEETVLGSATPVLVDFYADWCGPCKMIAPIMDNIAHDQTGRLLVAKVDADRAQEVAARHEIRGLPTVILFREGREEARSMGFEPDRLREMVARAVGAETGED